MINDNELIAENRYPHDPEAFARVKQGMAPEFVDDDRIVDEHGDLFGPKSWRMPRDIAALEAMVQHESPGTVAEPDIEDTYSERDIDAAIEAIRFWIRVAWFALAAGTVCGFVLGWVARGR